MNFFQHQDRARRQTRLLVAAFALAVLAIVLAMNLVVLTVLGQAFGSSGGGVAGVFRSTNLAVMGWTSAITLGVIGLASLFRMAQLRGGGAVVATELGGTLVEGNTTDPLRRRLLNVVEEMAIASGVPVPQVFVLEHEPGINAFAAGWSPTDAVVAVTRGALETLNREELQGVIAHEFSHVFNGDMRLNIRLMGVLFGILIIALVGRKMLSSMRYTVSRNRRNNGGFIIVIALAVMIIGYIGLFFGRWIQAAVSRQREFLADASAVQFTRSPDGIAGALKKIGATANGSQVVANTDEVGHMLFASALSGRLLATHPPLVDRIRKLEPGFQPGDFKTIAQQLAQASQRQAAEREQAAAAADSRPSGTALPGVMGGALGEALGPSLGDVIGVPGVEQLLLAGALLQQIPEPLSRRAHGDESASEVLLLLLLDDDAELRERQLLAIATACGGDSEAAVRELYGAYPALPPEQRLPLLELAMPALRRRPESQLVRLMRLVDELVQVDGRVSVFEYVFGRLLNHEIEQVLQPVRRAPGGRKRIADLADEIRMLLSLLAARAHPDDAATAKALYAVAVKRLGLDDAGPDVSELSEPWWMVFDAALMRLRELRLDERGQLLEALFVAVAHDGRIEAREYAFLRLIAGLLEVPLPLSLSTAKS
ncbi:MAG: M48 family metallopeptidase [Wenzhouxiangellaceae bacterium]|nr:M48 family metallopeptidase [Wenzhouxiangellaceae bacterium]